MDHDEPCLTCGSIQQHSQKTADEEKGTLPEKTLPRATSSAAAHNSDLIETEMGDLCSLHYVVNKLSIDMMVVDCYGSKVTMRTG